MNKNSVLQTLQGFLGEFASHALLLQELVSLIVGSGFENKFFILLVARLRFLSQMGIYAIKSEEFESVGGGLFSMHLAGHGFNIRIMYGFLPNREPVLLLAFYERGGKRKTDYTPYLKPASDRLSYMKEVYENEQYRI